MPSLAGSYYRGGTSRGLMLAADTVKQMNSHELSEAVLRIMGSPDATRRQLDGLGAGVSSLSKVAIVGVRQGLDANGLTFTFGQVGIDSPYVDFAGTCGNMAAAVGPFAVNRGLIEVDEGMTTVDILDANTRQSIRATFEVRNGRAVEQGTFRMAGVPRPGAPILLQFVEPRGLLGRGPLPTGSATDVLTAAGPPGGRTVSIVDVGNPTVFVRAADIGLDGNESLDELTRATAALDELGRIRAEAAALLGLCAGEQDADLVTPAVPKVALVGTPKPYELASGEMVTADDFDVSVRMLSMGLVHRALAASAAISAAVAAAIPETVVRELIPTSRLDDPRIRLGHLGGVSELHTEVTLEPIREVRSVGLTRTARRIADGHFYY